MKISIKNLGAIKQAEFTLAEFTIICGSNNTGKTYATHATYGFFDYLRSNPEFPIDKDLVTKLYNEGSVNIPLTPYINDLPKYLNNAAKKFSKVLYRVFAGNEKHFEESSLNFTFEKASELSPADVQIRFGSAKKSVLQIKSSENKTSLEASLIVDKTKDDVPPRHIIEDMISDAIGKAILESMIPRPFLASAERTGAAIFQKELDFTRNRLVEMLGDKSTKLNPIQFLGKFSGEYPIAVRKNVDFIRELPNITHRESFVLKHHPDLLESFQDIIGGEYKATKDGEIQYVPSLNKRIKLSLVESSSAVRSLLDIGFYLRHVAIPGDLLMVDEPELNLHPENQRRIARLFSRLANIGIKVFITTHSDYIIKELNTLIILNQGSERLEALARREGYRQSEFLDPEKVRVYIAEESLIMLDGAKRKTRCHTLVPADIDKKSGIEVRSFDKTIEDMNRIQEEIIWGGDK